MILAACNIFTAPDGPIRATISVSDVVSTSSAPAQITVVVRNVSTSALTLVAPCNGLVVIERPSGAELVAPPTPECDYTLDVLPGRESWTTTRSWKEIGVEQDGATRGQPLPPGHYRVAAYVRNDSFSVRSAAVDLEVTR